jgi:hypothetical protein
MMTRAPLLAVALTALSACGTDSIPGPSERVVPDTSVFVASNPVAPTTALAGTHLVQTSSYVSMPPGTAARGVEATVRNIANDMSVTAFMSGGGFDPTPIAGAAGDTLEVTVRSINGQEVLHALGVVPGKKKPTIIRTSPPPKKRDVPLNAVITIVFSEPVDPQTVNENTIQLSQGGTRIPLTQLQLDASGLRVDILPPSELQPTTTYSVFVTAGVRDLTGDPADGLLFEFTTQLPPPPEILPPESPFVAAGNMTVARWWHSSTLLPDGRVLLAGGEGDGGGDGGSTAEIYDPATGTFTATGSMTHPRRGHGAVLLANGKVLIVGPHASYGAELYDPATGTFTPTGSPNEWQYIQSTTLLQNGQVLIAGNIRAELYDPATGKFGWTGSFARLVYAYEATLLNDGRVLFAGDDTAQIYDPLAGLFTVAGQVGLGGVESHSQTLLADGRVLIAGGTNLGRSSRAVLFDPSQNTFTPTGSLLWARDVHAAVRLEDGRVLMVGGDGWFCTQNGNSCEFSGSVAEAEIYDPVAGTFSYVGNNRARRSAVRGTLLSNGDVLITGGLSYCGIGCVLGALASAEIYPSSAAARHARAP